MKILGINDGYSSGVALIVDGKLISAIQEERFNKVKNYGGFPQESLNWILKEHNLTPSDIDYIALAWETEPFKNITEFKKSKHKIFSTLSLFLPSYILRSKWLMRLALNFGKKRRKKFKGVKESLKEMGFENEKIILVEHHLCHAATPYYSSNFHNKYKKTLIFTYDGSGDGLCATVNIGAGNNIKRIHSQFSYDSLGILYTRVTEFLGMKPLEHEYKLMGLAPYSPDYLKKKAYDIFKKYFKLSKDGKNIINTSGRWGDTLIKKMRKDFQGIRFDGIAAGLQKLFEEVMFNWIHNWIKITGIRNVVVGGGSFMNVKLNMLLAQSKKINDFFPMPSGGDESLAIGAAFYVVSQYTRDEIKGIRDLYLGYLINEQEIKTALLKFKNKIAFKKVKDIELEVAKLVSRGKIVGRVKGRMEWGARALGNRSILAHPSYPNIVKKINKVVKKRDFWMPFAPSILYEKRNKYVINPKNVDAPYMILAFETKERAKTEIMAGLHPFDETARPQFVRKDYNPSYHKLISYFEKITGISGVLNTSCNIHGYPIVMDANDAIGMIINSDIDYIALENYLCWNKK